MKLGKTATAYPSSSVSSSTARDLKSRDTVSDDHQETACRGSNPPQQTRNGKNLLAGVERTRSRDRSIGDATALVGLA